MHTALEVSCKHMCYCHGTACSWSGSLACSTGYQHALLAEQCSAAEHLHVSDTRAACTQTVFVLAPNQITNSMPNQDVTCRRPAPLFCFPLQLMMWPTPSAPASAARRSSSGRLW
jgi:hypothetical protein